MELYIHHGRLDPHGGASDEEGNAIDDWGFEGPRLKNVVGFHVTYGSFFVCFATAADADRGKAETGWLYGNDDDQLELEFPPGGDETDCLKLWNAVRQRFEYFSDWGLM